MNQAASNRGTASRPSTTYPHKEAMKKKKRVMMRLRVVMLAVCCMILVIGISLVVLPMFRVKNIEVVGNSHYSTEQIIEFSGLTVGQESLQVNLQNAANALDSAAYITEVHIRMSSPFTVRIEIVEEPPLVVACNGRYYTFDKNFTVLEESASYEDFSDFLQVKLPEIAHIAVGESIVFRDESVDTSYLLELSALLNQTGLLPYVTLLDGAQEHNVAFVLGEKCRIEMGKKDALALKLALAQDVLLELGVDEGTFAIVNVSNPQKPTYRTQYLADTFAEHA